MAKAIAAVANYRGTDVITLSTALHRYGPIAQARWSTWRRKQQHGGALPEDFDATLAAIVAFADPVLSAPHEPPRTWDPAGALWQTT